MMLCLPEAIGVPGLFGQPPTWPGIDALNGHVAWPAAKSVSIPPGLDDPRWQGHLAIGYPNIEAAPVSCCGGNAGVDPGFGSATTEDIAFRALYDAVGTDRFLYLSWWVKADDLNSVLDDRLTVGFSRASGEALVLRITPSTSSGTKIAAPIGPVLVKTAPATGGAVNSWTENGGLEPAWIKRNTHVWLDPVSHRWAAQMRVPIGSGSVNDQVNLPDPFKMWFEVSVELPGNVVAPYSWPRNACVSSLCGAPSQLHVPPVTAWGDFHLSTGPGDPVCPTTGFVRLSVNDVGTQNSPTSNINLNSVNVFEAKPENQIGGPVAPGEINAEFRIANWGSIADPAAPWTVIPATGGTTNPASNSTSIANGAKGLVTMKWQLSVAERNQFEPAGPKSRHQCILVTLSGAHVFNPASVWRNMDFVSASRFERGATVSNVGLGTSPVPKTPRTAYILVEKLSMPPMPNGGNGGGNGGEDGGDGKQPDGPSPDGLGAIRENGDGDAIDLLVKAALATGDPTDRLELKPTIRYHVYHDTGIDITHDDGRAQRVVQPGTAFGFHLEHEGETEGWRDEIQGATRVTDRFYQLDVPEEGMAQITTGIEAVEASGEGCLNLIAILKRILRKIFRRS
jgi:hypothetical protein